MLWRPSHWKTLKKNAAFLHFNFCEYSKSRLRFFPLCFCDIPAWEFGCNGSSSAVSYPVHVYKHHERRTHSCKNGCKLKKESCGLQVKTRQKGHILRSWRSLMAWLLMPWVHAQSSKFPGNKSFKFQLQVLFGFHSTIVFLQESPKSLKRNTQMYSSCPPNENVGILCTYMLVCLYEAKESKLVYLVWVYISFHLFAAATLSKIIGSSWVLHRRSHWAVNTVHIRALAKRQGPLSTGKCLRKVDASDFWSEKKNGKFRRKQREMRISLLFRSKRLVHFLSLVSASKSRSFWKPSEGRIQW